MYLDTSLQTYLDDLASSKSAPGGGSAAALAGAMGAALASMVARLTLGKEKYADVQSEIEALLERTEQSRTRFQQLMQEDIEAYERLSACFKMPRTTDEERAARSEAIQARLVDAALVPLEMAERAAELAQFCQKIASIGNANILSDIATGVALIVSTGTGASSMVHANVRALKDATKVQELTDRLRKALATIDECNRQVANIVEERA